MPYVCGCPWRPEEATGHPGAGSSTVLENKLSWDPLEDQQVLFTTEPSLKPLSVEF